MGNILGSPEISTSITSLGSPEISTSMRSKEFLWNVKKQKPTPEGFKFVLKFADYIEQLEQLEQLASTDRELEVRVSTRADRELEDDETICTDIIKILNDEEYSWLTLFMKYVVMIVFDEEDITLITDKNKQNEAENRWNAAANTITAGHCWDDPELRDHKHDYKTELDNFKEQLNTDVNEQITTRDALPEWLAKDMVVVEMEAALLAYAREMEAGAGTEPALLENTTNELSPGHAFMANAYKDYLTRDETDIAARRLHNSTQMRLHGNV